MVQRQLAPLLSQSFFMFGPRGTGKTTLLKTLLPEGEATLRLDLLDPATEDRLSRRPESLLEEIDARRTKLRWVVIDEVQKVPKLLDVAHARIESSRVKFALTGSSARRLKRGSANLLAGRAFVNHLFPLTHQELGDRFNLSAALNWGTLPKAVGLREPEERDEFLRAYALTYLREEVWAEHLVRRLDPFRRFLDLAGAANGTIVNYSAIAQDIGVDIKTVQSYFEILEDTLIAVALEPYHASVRVRQRKNPKIFFFDTGVVRALNRRLEVRLEPGTDAFGRAFEHFVILECFRLNAYRRRDYRFSYLRTKDDAEIDLIVERPGAPIVLVELKSTEEVRERDIAALARFRTDFKGCEAICLSRDPRRKLIRGVTALPWQEGLREIGL